MTILTLYAVSRSNCSYMSGTTMRKLAPELLITFWGLKLKCTLLARGDGSVYLQTTRQIDSPKLERRELSTGGRGKWFWASSNCASSQTTWIDTLTLVDPNSTQLSYTHSGSHSHTFSSERSRKSGETVSTVSSAAVNNCVQAPWYLPCSVSPGAFAYYRRWNPQHATQRNPKQRQK